MNIDGYPGTDHHARLRRTAEALIEKGAAPPGQGASLGVDTLELLYRRASDPGSNADALKLLHELQTHQVELDLMYEQLQANEYEINGELFHYKALFEHGPVAYLVVANDGQIIESNEEASALFGESSQKLAGQAVIRLLAPSSSVPVSELFQSLSAPGSRASCIADLPANDQSASTRRVAISARSDEHGGSILMALCLTPDTVKPGS